MESSFADLAGYPVVIRLPVQWGDMDAFGHVNNTVYFRWFESARIAYFDRLDVWQRRPEDDLGPILAAIQCDYRRQIRFPDHVSVGARVEKIGRSSIVMAHALVSEAAGQLAAQGTSTLVMFDYRAQKPHPVPDELRAKLSGLEGRAL